ncbi:MAG: FecR domain-containing protein [Candidatus Solibacter usitatus]|nr:FecR domain-containing protein [Candidatus Solibacter usitatus]
MRALLLWLMPLAVFAGPTRFARIGEIEGPVEIQVHAVDAWQPAMRNMPLVESSWVRTAVSGKIEIELDEGSVLRLAGESQARVSDYTRLSTGQRVTLLTLERGVAYFTGEPGARDALILALPGAQISLRRGSRIRLEARDGWSQIAVIEGLVKFSSPGVELDLKEGHMARVEVPRSARFFLYREITGLDADRWSDERDLLLSTSVASKHAHGLQYGLQDLDRDGVWIDTKEYGAVWKPNVPQGWIPFRDGVWKWYDGVGFTWIAAEPWGWLPFHYGRWIAQSASAWVWAPGGNVFKPGDVYWLRDRTWLGWGPLAPGETWDARVTPRQYLKAHTTFARWAADARELLPGDEPDKPRDPLAAAVFVIAPPSPALAALRLDIDRPESGAANARVVFPDAVYAPPGVTAAEAPPAPLPEIPVEPPAPPAPRVEAFAPTQSVPLPVPDPIEVYYPVPVYTGIVVVNPPERPRPERVPVTPPLPARPPSPATPAIPQGGVILGPPPVAPPRPQPGPADNNRPPVTRPVEPGKQNQ